MNRKIVIIGGGVAGLSAGIYAKLNGFDAEIVEMHSITGGQCTAWERKGFRFDYCLHWLVGTSKGPFNDIWKETNALNDNVQVIDHEIHTKVFTDSGQEFIIYTNLARWEEYLCSLAPEDTRQIKRMCNDMKKSDFLQPFADPPGLRNPIASVASLFSMMPVMMLFLRYGRKDSADYFKNLGFTNETLKFFFNEMFGSRDFSALAFIMMFAWFNQKNAGYLLGGSLPLAERMTDKFLSLGGTLTTKKRVTKIIVENNVAKGVVLSDGREIRSDYVISAADGHSTIYELLEGKYLTGKITRAYNEWKLFSPIVQVSFGINRKIESDTPVETWLVKDLMIGSNRVEHGFSIMNYAFDKTMAAEGKSVIAVRFESPWEIWENIDTESYAREKELIKKDVLELMEKRYPGFSGNVEITDVATPLTDVKYTGVWKGSYEGFLPSGKNLMDNISPVIKGIGKFYMAGQWLFPGGGLPPAGQSGKWAIQYICREEKKEFRTRIG